jgi:hypothetical protein
VKLPVIHGYEQETIVILNWTDHFDTRCRRNGDSGLMIILEREYHQRKSQQILHRMQSPFATQCCTLAV